MADTIVLSYNVHEKYYNRGAVSVWESINQSWYQKQVTMKVLALASSSLICIYHSKPYEGPEQCVMFEVVRCF